MAISKNCSKCIHQKVCGNNSLMTNLINEINRINHDDMFEIIVQCKEFNQTPSPFTTRTNPAITDSNGVWNNGLVSVKGELG